ncbi:MAG: hypothetical protein J2P23_01540 [Microlunatus sp.]|nr:hypothetical protein [Microlunatus sp.]
MVIPDLPASAVSVAYDVRPAPIDLVPLGLPNVGPIRPPGAKLLGTVLAWATWVSLAVTVRSVIAAGAVTTIRSRRGEGAGQLHHIGLALVAVVIISAGSTPVNALA